MRHHNSPRRFSVKVSDGDLRRLRVFCAVARCGGFAAAESELQMGLPSISRVIKDLEIIEQSVMDGTRAAAELEAGVA